MKVNENEILKMIGDEESRRIYLELQKSDYGLSSLQIIDRMELKQTTAYRKLLHLRKHHLIYTSFVTLSKFKVSTQHYKPAFSQIKVRLGKGKISVITEKP